MKKIDKIKQVNISEGEYIRLKAIEDAYKNGHLYILNFGFNKQHMFSITENEALREFARVGEEKNERIDTLLKLIAELRGY